MTHIEVFDYNNRNYVCMSYSSIFVSLYLGMFFSSGLYLMYYAYNKIIDRYNKCNKNKLYIIRRLPFLNLDSEIRKQIKKNSNRNYRILSSYDFIEKDGYFDVRNLAKYNSIVLTSFIKLIRRGQRDIYLMNRNQYLWEYESYVKLAKLFNYEPIVIEFVKEDMHNCIENISSDETRYNNALNEIKKYEMDNKLFTKRIIV